MSIHVYASDLSCGPFAFPLRETRRTVKGLNIAACSDELWEILGLHRCMMDGDGIFAEIFDVDIWTIKGDSDLEVGFT